MALFCSPCKFPILCPKFQRNYAIQGPFSSRFSILTTSSFEISRISVLAPGKLVHAFTEQAKCCSSLSSAGELDEGVSSSVIIFIKGLAQSTTEGVLKSAFSKFGEVSRVKIVNDKKTKQPLGFAYIWFTSEEHAQDAVEEMNGKFFEGKFIHVTIAKPGACKRRPSPGPYKF